MPYALEFADTAVEDLERLIDSLPPDRQGRALDAVEAACLEFAADPRHGRTRGRSDPSFPIDFQVDGTGYHWVGTYVISEDERMIWVVHIFRVPL